MKSFKAQNDKNYIGLLIKRGILQKATIVFDMTGCLKAIYYWKEYPPLTECLSGQCVHTHTHTPLYPTVMDLSLLNSCLSTGSGDCWHLPPDC